jgi:hypothetical protein
MPGPDPLAHGPPGAPEARRLYHRPPSFPVIQLTLASPFAATSIQADARHAQRQIAWTCPGIHAADVGRQSRSRSCVPKHADEVRRDRTPAAGPSHRGCVPGALCRRPRADVARPPKHADGDSSAPRKPWTAATSDGPDRRPARAARNYREGQAADSTRCGHGGVSDQAVDVGMDRCGIERDAPHPCRDRRRVGRLTNRRPRTPPALTSDSASTFTQFSKTVWRRRLDRRGLRARRHERRAGRV